MHKDCTQKLLNAGFVLIDAKRNCTDGKDFQIWQKTKERYTWHILKKGFATKAELKREMVALLKLSNIIDLYNSLHRIDDKNF